MCHSLDCRPPDPPAGGVPGDHGALRLTASDGNRFAAYGARAAGPSARGVVIMPDVRGLHEFYKDLAVRFAEAGFDAVAMDYYGRTAADDDRGEGFAHHRHRERAAPETVAADLDACLDHLATSEGGGPRHVFSVGFCFGGSASLRASALQAERLAGCIAFYAFQPMTFAAPWLDRMRRPLLMLTPGNDVTPLAEFEEFESEARARGVDVEQHVYPGAVHSFFDRRCAEYREACEDSWHRVLAFTERVGRPKDGADGLPHGTMA